MPQTGEPLLTLLPDDFPYGTRCRGVVTGRDADRDLQPGRHRQDVGCGDGRAAGRPFEPMSSMGLSGRPAESVSWSVASRVSGCGMRRRWSEVIVYPTEGECVRQLVAGWHSDRHRVLQRRPEGLPRLAVAGGADRLRQGALRAARAHAGGARDGSGSRLPNRGSETGGAMRR